MTGPANAKTQKHQMEKKITAKPDQKHSPFSCLSLTDIIIKKRMFTDLSLSESGHKARGSWIPLCFEELF